MAKTKKKAKKAAKRPARARRGTAPKASSTEKALNRVELDIRKLQDKRDKLLTRAIREQEVRAHSTIKQAKKKAEMDANKSDVSFGSQIRSYVFQPYTMVNDHRTELKIPDVQRVMDGDIDPFIEAYLAEQGASPTGSAS